MSETAPKTDASRTTQAGLESVDLDAGSVDRAVFGVLPLQTMERLQAVVTERRPDGTYTVAISDPMNLAAIDDLHLALPGVRIVVADPEAVTATLHLVRRHLERIEDEQKDDAFDSQVADVELNDDGTVAKTVNRILEAAIQDGASDIHFEPEERGLIVRFRIDGVLGQFEELRRGIATGVINRLKVIGGMDVAERRKPQDGRFNRVVGDRSVDCRVETVPSAWGGEGAVLRLFDQGRGIKSMREIGFHTSIVERFERAIDAPHGIVLVTGPTGSGKTTTLYACLDQVARPERKTLTVEDPCEIRSEGITQVQVNEKAGLTFATALRSFLRADPDVILVGEIRDTETAALAAQAALTGHLVLSTLHTNEAVGAATRLANMGLEGYIIASSLRAVLAQRLIRRLCVECKVVYTPDSDALADFAGRDLPAQLHKANPGGCRRCRNTGYSGRLPVGELVVINDELAEAIVQNAPSHELNRIAIANGTRPLREDALDWAESGDTSLDELHRGGLL